MNPKQDGGKVGDKFHLTKETPNVTVSMGCSRCRALELGIKQAQLALNKIKEILNG